MSTAEVQFGSASPALDAARSALLLDIDGTLLDIAATPDEVVVTDTLRRDLKSLTASLGGALALVSGRSLRTIDALFSPLKLAAIGGHGAEIRPSTGDRDGTIHAEALPFAVKAALIALAEQYSGTTIEDKNYTMALHYRAVPEKEHNLLDAVGALSEQYRSSHLKILRGKCVVEVKSAEFDKGKAVHELLTRLPFRDRMPVFIGDDVTDEAVFAILPQYDGVGASVGRPMAGASYMFRDPVEVRQWLGHAARSLGHKQ